MERIKRIKKEISLNRFFMVFLAHALLSLICACILWACLLAAAVCFHIITPANAAERAVSAWCASLDGHSAIAPEDIPAGADYAIFDRSGSLLRTTLEDDSLKTASELALSGEPAGIRRQGAHIYLRLETDTQYVIVSYRLVAMFASPRLRHIFPNAELFFFVLLLLLIFADLVLIAIRYARKLSKELQKLAAAAEQIRSQTLDFNVQRTKLTEFNRIMDSLEQLKADLKHSLGEQWAMEQLKKRQLTALAHDIKTPLAIVKGNAELLAETRLTEEQREYTAFILSHAEQIHRYVVGMMEISEPTSASDTFCEIRELLSSACRNIENLGKKKRLSCSLRTEDLPKSLPVRSGGLQRILDNLIDNAVQYSPEEGIVFLTAELDGNDLFVRVQDQGDGFSGEALSLAAAEFYRSDPSRNSKEHFGLGLAIAKQIVTELGGTLRLENASPKGGLVTVKLPVDFLSQ